MSDYQEPQAAAEASIPATNVTAGLVDGTESKPVSGGPAVAHPSGRESHGQAVQVLRCVSFFIFFTTCVLTICFTQFVGAPLYFVNREWYYAYMSMTKRFFAITVTYMTNIWGPTTIRISGDESMAGEIQPTSDGGVQFSFPERMVLIANHQIYTDWLYLWWVGYCNRPRMDGHLYIILKESLKWIPLIGTGMMFYSFIFMSRKMATDQPRLAYRLSKLKQKKKSPTGETYMDPMWLLLFPEGTNLSNNGRRKSAAWAAKNGLRDPEHVMLPRSTGMFFCLNELKGSLEYVYDCTVAYEGIPRGKYGQDLFGLSSTYFEGRPPKSVNFYWRRFRLTDIPLDDEEKFALWLRDEWYKKDALMEEYMSTGRFPGMAGAKADFIEAEVKTRHPWEILQLFTVVGICGLVWNNVKKATQAATSFLG